MNIGYEISPTIECVIKNKVCYIEKLIDHPEYGKIVRYCNDDATDFCPFENLPKEALNTIKEKYPELLFS